MSPLMARLLLVTLIFLASFPVSSPFLHRQTILDAVEVLSESGFINMSLTLQHFSETLISQSPSATVTIFAPSDDAFEHSGRPSLSLLQYHLSPFKLSLQNLQSLPLGTKIPTFVPNNFLLITAPANASGTVFVNHVPIIGSSSVIFDVGQLAVFGIGSFFDPSLQNSSSADVAFNCMGSSSLNFGPDSISKASIPLKAKGYSVIASLLGLQLPMMRTRMKITVLAPADVDIKRHVGNLSLITSIFRAHVLPCRLDWADLVMLEEGVQLRTLMDGFSIEYVIDDEDELILNGVPILFPDLYTSDSLVVHGLQQKVTSPRDEQSKYDYGILALKGTGFVTSNSSLQFYPVNKVGHFFLTL